MRHGICEPRFFFGRTTCRSFRSDGGAQARAPVTRYDIWSRKSQVLFADEEAPIRYLAYRHRAVGHSVRRLAIRGLAEFRR